MYASGGQSVNHLSADDEGDILDNAFVIINYCDASSRIVSRASLDLCMFAEASQEQEEISIVGAKGKLEAALPSLEVRTGLRQKHSLANVVVEAIDDDRIKVCMIHYFCTSAKFNLATSDYSQGDGTESLENDPPDSSTSSAALHCTIQTNIMKYVLLSLVVFHTLAVLISQYFGHHHGSSFLEHLDVLEQVHRHVGAAPQIGKTAGLEQGLLSVAIGVAAHLSIDEARPVNMKEIVSESELAACDFYA